MFREIDTVLCQFLETGTSDRCLIRIVQLPRFSGFSIYPLSVPLKLIDFICGFYTQVTCAFLASETMEKYQNETLFKIEKLFFSFTLLII